MLLLLGEENYQTSSRKSANARKSRRMNNYTVEYPENK